jgi:hypothetical protein
MATHFARLNIQIPEQDVNDIEARVNEWEEILDSAAVCGYAEEHEFFYIRQHRIIGISVPFDSESAQSLLEAGSVLGYVHRSYEESEKIPAGSTWLSIHDPADETLSSVYDPNM